MKVLVTGGAGYIGSHCVKVLLDKGVETWCLDNLSKGHKEAVLTSNFIQGDIGDSKKVDVVLANQEFDAIIHLAALSVVAESTQDPEKYYLENFVKMKILLDAAIKYKVPNFVFSSTAAVYGIPKAIPIHEDHETMPINPYGHTKLAGENMLRDYGKAYGLNYCILRYFNAAGASPEAGIGESHNPESHLIPLLCEALANKSEDFLVYGNDYGTEDGTCIRDYIHVLDLAEAHFLALEYLHKGGSSGLYNLGGSKGHSVYEIINKMELITGDKLCFKVANRRQGDPDVLVASNEKAKKELGWEPKRSAIDYILADAWEWYSEKKY